MDRILGLDASCQETRICRRAVTVMQQFATAHSLGSIGRLIGDAKSRLGMAIGKRVLIAAGGRGQLARGYLLLRSRGIKEMQYSEDCPAA